MIPNLFILDTNGDVLIEKHWSGVTKRSVTELFWEEVSKAPKLREVQPVISTAHHIFIHMHRLGVIFLTVVQEEVPPLLILEFHQRVIAVLLDYFQNHLTDTTIKEHFSLVYQLLDEMVDGGFPSTVELNQLREMIAPPSVIGSMKRRVTGNFAVSNDLAAGTTSKIPWRKAGVKYLTNEVYFDVNEEIDCIIGTNNMVISSNIVGSIECSCRLSAMPDLTLSFVQPQFLEDVTLHRCVRINKFKRERVVSFVPPDGNFRLLTYRTKGGGDLPVYVQPHISFTAISGRVEIKIGPKFTSSKKIVEGVWVEIPFPDTVQSTALTCTHGDVKHNELTKVSRWSIGRFPKDASCSLGNHIIISVSS